MRNVGMTVVRCVSACAAFGLLMACSPISTIVEQDVARKTNADLSALTLSSGTLTPAFAAGTIAYTTTVGSDVASIMVTATKAAPNAKIEARVNGGSRAEISSGAPSPALSLNVGANTLEVRVTAEDGSTTKTYTINTYRLSPMALLSALTISVGTLRPVFDPNIENYSVSVANAVSSLTVTAAVAHAGATIQIRVNAGEWQAAASGSPSPSLSLNLGDNPIEVKVTAEDASVFKAYKIAILRIFPGAMDSDFAVGSGANNNVISIVLQNDGKILIGGGFTSYNGISRGYIARLNSDGSLDTSFLATGSGADNFVISIVLQNDGKILIGGVFASYNGIGRGHIARLNSDGSLDTSFLANGAGANDKVNSLVLQMDGKILIGGDFHSYNGTIKDNVARLNTDGSLDSSFVAPEILGVNAFALEGDGKLLIAVAAGGDIVRLKSDGSQDTSFTPLTDEVFSLSLQSDGKILIGGLVYSNNSGYVARLNTDGSQDTTFTAAVTRGGQYGVESIAVQSDGKILFGGDFTSCNGTSRGHFARLNSDGSLDTAFLAYGVGANLPVFSIALQSDRKILIAGMFTSYNGISYGGIARMWGDVEAK